MSPIAPGPASDELAFRIRAPAPAIGRLLLIVIALAAFLTTLVIARSIGLSTAEPTQRMRYHALPVAMSQLYHGRQHDYTAHWQVAMAFQAPEGTVQELIAKAVTQPIPANPQTYFWTADDRGLADFVYGAFKIFGPSVPSLFYFWFILLGASLCTALLAFRRDPWSLALIASGMIAIGVIVPIYARANGGLPIHISESRMFDVLGCIALLHLMLSIFRPVSSQLWLHAGGLLFQAVLLGFLLHTRSTLIWLLLVIILTSLAMTIKSWIDRRPARDRLQSLAPAALIISVWAAVLGYQSIMLNPAYRTEIGPRTVWHNVLIGLAVSPVYAQRLTMPVLDDASATEAVLRDLAQRQDPRLRPDWNVTNIMNSLGGHSRFDWVSYETAARALVVRTLWSDPLASLQLALWFKPKKIAQELLCVSMHLVPACGNHMGPRDYLRPTRQAGLLSAFWLIFAVAVGTGLGLGTNKAQGNAVIQDTPAVRTYVLAALTALLVSLLLSYLFYAAPTQLGGAYFIIATTLYFAIACAVCKWINRSSAARAADGLIGSHSRFRPKAGQRYGKASIRGMRAIATSTATALRHRFFSPTQMVANPEPAGTVIGAVGGLFIATSLMFTSAIVFPHYLADDLWAFRPADDNFPSSLFMSVAQGRPVFAFLLDLSRDLHASLGHWAVSLVRAQAVLFMFLFAWGIYRWTLVFVGSRGVAFLVSVATIALPSVQMYVVGGPWLAWAWAFCAWVPILIVRRFSGDRSLWVNLAVCGLISIGLILGLATYQSTPFLIFGLLILPVILSTRHDKLAAQAGVAVVLLALSVCTYFLIWLYLDRTMGIAGETRYSPSTLASTFTEHWDLLPLRLGLFINDRLPTISALWDVRSEGFDFSRPILLILAAGFLSDILLQRSVGSCLRTVARWMIAGLFFLACDAPPLIAKPGVNIYSYMTAGPTAVALMMLLLAACVRIFQFVAGMIGSPTPAAGLARPMAWACPTAAALFGALGLYTTTAYYVLPAWLDQALVRTQLREELARTGQITSVIAYSRIVRVLNSKARGEFSWSNMSADFYVHWLVRRVLDELGQNSDVKIEVRGADGKTYGNVRFSVAPTENGIATVDTRGIVLDRNAAPETRYFEILKNKSPPGARVGHSQQTISTWASLPAGERYIPVRVVETSFHYSDHGAGGEAALTDGDLNVPAADAKGVTADTRATLQLSEPTPISRIRVLRDAVVQTESDTMLKVEGSLDGKTWRNLGRLVLKASASSVSDFVIMDTEPLSTIRLSYVGGKLADNIWISEIGVTTK